MNKYVNLNFLDILYHFTKNKYWPITVFVLLQIWIAHTHLHNEYECHAHITFLINRVWSTNQTCLCRVLLIVVTCPRTSSYHQVFHNLVVRCQECAGYRNYTFEFCVLYTLTVGTATNSLVWGPVKFIFIFKIKRSIQQDLCSIAKSLKTLSVFM